MQVYNENILISKYILRTDRVITGTWGSYHICLVTASMSVDTHTRQSLRSSHCTCKICREKLDGEN